MHLMAVKKSTKRSGFGMTIQMNPFQWYFHACGTILFRICNSNFCTIQMKPLHQYSYTVLLFFIRNFSWNWKVLR